MSVYIRPPYIEVAIFIALIAGAMIIDLIRWFKYKDEYEKEEWRNK